MDLMSSAILVRGTVTSSFILPGRIRPRAGEIDLRARQSRSLSSSDRAASVLEAPAL